MRRVVFSSVLDATVIRRSGPPPPAREALRRPARPAGPFSTGTAPAPLDGPRCCTLLALATLRGRQAVESETTPRRRSAAGVALSGRVGRRPDLHAGRVRIFSAAIGGPAFVPTFVPLHRVEFREFSPLAFVYIQSRRDAAAEVESR